MRTLRDLQSMQIFHACPLLALNGGSHKKADLYADMFV